ncbi:MAG TPA: S41 family peptidase [Bryobacteraceae bacterium]|nr:S41 family peptidase [Bryobacteraceae bacterium]
MRFLCFLVVLFYSAAPSLAQRSANLESFEVVWRTVRDRHPDPGLNGLDWQAIHDATRPRIAAAKSISEVRSILTEMLNKLGSSHYAIIPKDLYAPAEASGQGSVAPDLEPVFVDGKAIVGRVEPDSVAARAGIRQGMVIESINGAPVDPNRRAVAKSLKGPADEPVKLSVVDANGVRKEIDVPRTDTSGKIVEFGNLPRSRLVFESRALEGGIGYIRFNEFLDPVSIMPQFEAAIGKFAKAPGIIMDLRGNAGGIGVMAMGIAGFFVDQPGLKLGEMKMRDTTLKFVIFPRATVYKGPLALLVDSGSASTTEILAEGLQDLNRARIFGTTTAGAALPSDIIRLPNGDGFQFAQASYTSEKGKVLEGAGVVPDVEVRQTHEAIAAGHDLVIEAAENWIRSQKS